MESGRIEPVYYNVIHFVMAWYKNVPRYIKLDQVLETTSKTARHHQIDGFAPSHMVSRPLVSQQLDPCSIKLRDSKH